MATLPPKPVIDTIFILILPGFFDLKGLAMSMPRFLKNLQLGRRLRNLTGSARQRYYDDDFNWETYTRDKYGPQQEILAQSFDMRIDDRVRFDPQSRQLVTGDAKLIPNSHVCYEIVGLLGATSVLEIGCGGGDHLRNIKKLYPHIPVHGGDRSTEQIKFLRSRNPEIADQAFLLDITLPLSSRWPRADLVYTQAVLMHIKTGVSHLVALANMFHLAQRYVVLVENFGCHHFVNDIRKLQEGGHLPWEQVHFYQHAYQGKPFGLIVSRQSENLPSLGDYFELPSARKIRYTS